MPVQLKNGFVLLSGGAVALDPNCCCCDFTVIMGYTVGLISVSVISTIGSPTLSLYDLRIYRNGVLVYSEDNRNGSGTFSIPVTAGQTVTATATGAACSANASCTRYSVTVPAITPCTPFNPAGFADGTCYSINDFYAGYQYNPHPITAVVSGLAGPMTSLNGTYTVDCEDPVEFAQVFWDAGASRGSVQIIWDGPYAVRAFVTSRQSNFLGGFIIGGRDFTSNYGTGSKTVAVKTASCAACTSTLTATYNTEGPVIVSTGGTGQPADGVVIAWTFG